MIFATSDQAAGYLAGMIDGEGHVASGATPRKRQIEIANTDITIVDAVRSACEMLRIAVRVSWRQSRQPNRRPAAIMRIGGIDNLTRVHRLVPIRSAKKRAALEHQLAGYTRKVVLPITEELVDMYVNKGMSANEIATKYGLQHCAAVTRRLVAAGVVLRPRGQASRMGVVRGWRAAS